MKEFFATNDSSISRFNYYRVLLLGAFDILVTLPVGIIGLISSYTVAGKLELYTGWTTTHASWDPQAMPISFWRSPWQYNLSVRSIEWTPVFLAFVFFLLFGLTEEAKCTYSRTFWTIAKIFGFMPAPRAVISNMIFESFNINPM